jgi:hypothetical protein
MRAIFISYRRDDTEGYAGRLFEDLCERSAGAAITRTIVVRPDTRYVNVTGGEVIRFQVGDRSFVWSFNGTRTSFDLARVAPPSTLDHKVTAYVAPNPLNLRRAEAGEPSGGWRSVSRPDPDEGAARLDLDAAVPAVA